MNGSDNSGSLSPEQKIAANVWDHVDDALPVIARARVGGWSWLENTECKYIELRIDMRDGGCIIKNREGQRISPEQLRRQIEAHRTRAYLPWPEVRMPLSAWQQEQASKVGPNADAGVPVGDQIKPTENSVQDAPKAAQPPHSSGQDQDARDAAPDAIPTLDDLRELIFDPRLDAGIELHKQLERVFAELNRLRAPDQAQTSGQRRDATGSALP